ncbi:hypothetical protein SISNIDRAFT_404278 [Sistotremastrum niveocremeum HHB9708]|uniref:RRM domain-containing protein n=1 Tax=Sistotremastrum niveocremeum HHB9708 TaxID=1314777 RepID=A0A165A195_9AGAM|nr:hypothetical protein SISNIDRAFT_404278 [Sistotremastrum niveocremeum HHB9708]
MSSHKDPLVAPAGGSYESLAAAFAQDPRIHFSKVSGTWQYEDEDGKEMEWDVTKGVWKPVVDEDLVKAQQAAYSVAGVDEEAPAAPVVEREKKKNKKRKVEEDYTSNTDPSQPGPSIKRGKTGNPKKDNGTTENVTKTVSKNTAVYVSGLPLDAESEEIASYFGKCGVLMEDDDGNPRIKMYANEEGRFNGEALVVYFKEDSVLLAERLLDEAEFRLGDSSTRLKVHQADFSHKRTEGKEVTKRVIDKKKATQRIHKIQKKLEEWDSEDEFGPAIEKETQSQNQSRVVILKHMFTLAELAEDVSLLLDLKEDVREECASLGDVTNVVLYDKEEDGIMTVKFRDPLSAKACVMKMNGRFFAGRKVEATLGGGKLKFRRSGRADGDDGNSDGEADESERKRLEDFAKWLEKDG